MRCSIIVEDTLSQELESKSTLLFLPNLRNSAPSVVFMPVVGLGPLWKEQKEGAVRSLRRGYGPRGFTRHAL